MRWRTSRAVLLAMVIALAAWYVALGSTNAWDFETYYHAARAYHAGLNPYQVETLTTMAGRQVELPFLYPPITLVALWPLALLPLGLASALWLALKCVLLVLLLVLWRRAFLPESSTMLLVTICLIGFNLATLWDLRTGNVALLEATLLWLAFTAYVRGHRVVFVCLVALASVFKLYPILFLGLALVPSPSKPGDLRLVGLGLALFLVLIALPVPALTQWIAALTREAGSPPASIAVGPNAVSLAHWLLGFVGGQGWLVTASYVLYAILLLYVSGPMLRRAWDTGSPRTIVSASVLLWLLLGPRVMVYSYTMAVAPAVVLLDTCFISPVRRAVILGLILLPGIIRLLPGNPPEIVGALPLFSVLVLWVSCGSRRHPVP